MTINHRDLDNHITGHWGEDQFKGAEMNSTDVAKERDTTNFDVTYIPDSDSFIALAGGNDWTGLSGHGATPRKALLELIDEMNRSLEEDQ